MTEQFALVVDTDTSFSPAEVTHVVENYVCAVCHGELTEVQVPNEQRRLIVCIEHGNTCIVGRVTRATVSIETERAYKSYHEVIRNLPDLWGHLVKQGFEYSKAIKLRKDYVCAICGGTLLILNRQDHPHGEIVDIGCQTHGNINDCGYTKKSEFKYDFQRILKWSKEHRSK